MGVLIFTEIKTGGVVGTWHVEGQREKSAKGEKSKG